MGLASNPEGKSLKEFLTTDFADFTDEYTATHPCDPRNPWLNAAIEISQRSLRSFAAKTSGCVTRLELMNGRKGSQRTQKETPFFTTQETEESRGERWQENVGQEYLERRRDMVSLSGP